MRKHRMGTGRHRGGGAAGGGGGGSRSHLGHSGAAAGWQHCCGLLSASSPQGELSWQAAWHWAVEQGAAVGLLWGPCLLLLGPTRLCRHLCRLLYCVLIQPSCRPPPRPALQAAAPSGGLDLDALAAAGAARIQGRGSGAASREPPQQRQRQGNRLLAALEAVGKAIGRLLGGK